MENTKVVFREDGVYGEVQLFSAENKAGKMDVSVSDGKLRVYHTEVDDLYEGKGFAKILLNQLVSYAIENHLKIIPLCPYVLAQFKRHPELYEEVWKQKK